MLTSTAIIANDVTIGYKNHPVIQHFSGQVLSGQFVGVFGPNGAGKTTLLLSLLGLIPPLSGELSVLGQTPCRGHTAIGYVPQNIAQIPVAMSGYAILAATVNGQHWGLPITPKKQRQQILEVVDLVGASAYLHRPIAQLSGGERRRLYLAQALLGNPKILLLDEPLANLDPHFQYAFIELLIQIRKQLQITFLLTAHDVNPLLHAMSHVLYLARGKAVIGTVQEIITNEVLSSLYGSPMEVIQHKNRIFVMHSSTGHTENVSCHH